MSLSPSMWSQARVGARPASTGLRGVATEELAAFGRERVAQREQALSESLIGAGPLQRWLEEPGVTDVSVNGDGRVWVDQGLGMADTGERLAPLEARALAVRLAAASSRRLDDAAPWVDAILPTGERLHAILPPLVQGGAHITLRVPATTRLDLAALVASGTVPAQWEGLLRGVVTTRCSVLISGGTGAGKTTLLGALLSEVDPTERILVVEDAAEVQVAHPHCVRLQARSANVEGVGEVSLTVLVRQSLRMRPDRLVLGEARGEEIRDLLAALNTGHDGGFGTIHANSPADVPARVEALGALAGMSAAAVRTQLASAVDLVLHLRRDKGRRLLACIGVVLTDADGLHVETAATWDGCSVVSGPAWARLRERGVVPS